MAESMPPWIEAGRIAEFRLGLEAEPDPALLRTGIEQAPAEQLGAGRPRKVVERGLDHVEPRRLH
jgi:hypothetical protein